MKGTVRVGDPSSPNSGDLAVYGDIKQHGTTTFETGTGAVTLAGDVAVTGGYKLKVGAPDSHVTAMEVFGPVTIGSPTQEAKDFTLYGKFVQGDGTDGGTPSSPVASTFLAGTGAITLNGNVAIGGTSTLTVGAAGTAGATTLYGAVTVGSPTNAAASTFYGNVGQDGAYTFTTGTGAVTLKGSTAIATPASTFTVGTPSAAISSTFNGGTTLGAPTAAVSLQIYGNILQDDTTGPAVQSTFKSGTGAVTLRGNTEVSSGKSFDIGGSEVVCSTADTGSTTMSNVCLASR
jgi:hypothetical protein